MASLADFSTLAQLLAARSKAPSVPLGAAAPAAAPGNPYAAFTAQANQLAARAQQPSVPLPSAPVTPSTPMNWLPGAPPSQPSAPAAPQASAPVPMPQARPAAADSTDPTSLPPMGFFARNTAMMQDPMTGAFIDPTAASQAQGSDDVRGPNVIQKMLAYLHNKDLG